MISARGRAFAKLGAFSIKPIVLQILQMKIYIPKIVIWISAIKMFFMTFPNLHSANPPSPTAFHKPHHANFRFESLQWSFRRVQQSGMGAFSMWCLCGFCFFWLFSFPWRMILSQCFCLSWHFMWAITALRLKHFSFLLLLLWSQHRRSFSQNFPWSCHRKIRKRWKGKALTQAAWLKIWNRVRNWFGRSETWIKLWPRQRRGSYLGTLWSSQNSLVILFLHSLIFDPSGMENS